MSRTKHITLPYGIEVVIIKLSNSTDGHIKSDLKEFILDAVDSVTCDNRIISIGVNMLEGMILEHALKGLNITSQKYLKGIEEAVSILALMCKKIN